MNQIIFYISMSAIFIVCSPNVSNKSFNELKEKLKNDTNITVVKLKAPGTVKTGFKTVVSYKAITMLEEGSHK
jgi:hypothetical protein